VVIDLASSLWGSIAAGIVMMIIAGSYHYIRTLVTLNITNKQLDNILSELNSMQKNYKETISKINEDKNAEISKAIERALDIYGNKIDEILKHNKPRSQNFLAELYKNQNISHP